MTPGFFALFILLAVISLTFYGAWCWLTDQDELEAERFPSSHVHLLPSTEPYDWERTWAEELTDEQCERLLRAVREEVHGDG